MSGESLHEPAETLSSATIDRHRAIASLMEELEAIDWYDQRIDATADEELKAILRHNRDEEKEHAAMVLEWLRRHDPVLDQQLRAHLFKDGEIAAAATAIPSRHRDSKAERAGPAGRAAGKRAARSG